MTEKRQVNIINDYIRGRGPKFFLIEWTSIHNPKDKKKWKKYEKVVNLRHANRFYRAEDKNNLWQYIATMEDRVHIVAINEVPREYAYKYSKGEII